MEIQKRGLQLNSIDIKESLFVFGHTHKPFSWHWDAPENPIGIPIHNTGGWVVETPEPASNHGASMVLLDENFNSASILLYKEIDDITPNPVTVQQASGVSAQSTDFFECIQQQVATDKDSWQSFAQTVVKTVRDRRVKFCGPRKGMEV